MTHRKTFATLSDVARRAGVSKGTVSAVINGSRSNTKVSSLTRERIEAAAAELNYRPHAIARSLTRRRTNIIGFYSGYSVVDTRSLFLAEIMVGFKDGCAEHRQDLLIHGIFRGNSVQDIYTELSNGKIDGLVLYSPPTDPLIRLLVDSHLPVVAIADPIPALASVVVDDAQGSRLLAEHLGEKGHRRILYRRSSHAAISTDRRFAAFREAGCRYGMTLREGHVPGEEERRQVPTPPLNENLLIQRLSTAEKQILCAPRDEAPTAAVCWCDGSAYTLLAECRSLGIRVPEDLAIVGFDGLTTIVPPIMELTTIRAPWAKAAHTAVALLVAQIEGKEVPQETVLPAELVLGETT